jgi:hypothetical protein
MYGASRGDTLERLTFDARTTSPSFAARQVGPIDPVDDPIAGLLRRVGVDPWLGRPLDEITTATVDASAQLSPLQELRDPGRTRRGLAVVDLMGDVRREDKVLLEVNGTVVTAAPVTGGAGRSRSAVLLLPPGALRASGNELAVAIVRGDQVLGVSDA